MARFPLTLISTSHTPGWHQTENFRLNLSENPRERDLKARMSGFQLGACFCVRVVEAGQCWDRRMIRENYKLVLTT